MLLELVRKLLGELSRELLDNSPGISGEITGGVPEGITGYYTTNSPRISGEITGGITEGITGGCSLIPTLIPPLIPPLIVLVPVIPPLIPPLIPLLSVIAPTNALTNFFLNVKQVAEIIRPVAEIIGPVAEIFTFATFWSPLPLRGKKCLPKAEKKRPA